MKTRIHAAVPAMPSLALLYLITAVLAHGGEGMEDMAHADAAPQPAGDLSPESYFLYPEYQSTLYSHIALMVVAWVFMLPVAVMLSLAGSRYTLTSQLVFIFTNGVGLIFGMMYNENTPDLYPNNAHHKLGWLVSAVFCAHVAVGILGRLAGAFKPRAAGGHQLFSIPITTAAMVEHQRNVPGSPRQYRFSNDSGQGTEPNTASLFTDPRPSMSSSSLRDEEAARKEQGLFLGDRDDMDSSDDEDDDFAPKHQPPTTRHGIVGRALSITRRAAGMVSSKLWTLLALGYNTVDRVILILGFVTFCTGIITQGRFFEGPEVFSGLAHWIKGGVFFWLGVLTLGRWAGAFGEIGWAWNVRSSNNYNAGWCPSAEFVESALIFFYGSTNIFLEHLGGDGAADRGWSAQDLEHVSITVLFIGGGLCGMLVESSAVRDLLNTTVARATAGVDEDEAGADENRHQPKRHGVSLNPIPALVILLLGIMMSSHTQANHVSGMVHAQWGNLLKGAAVARALTYVLMYLRPPTSVLPSRPPTELLAAFGLSAGGIIFMASASDTIQGMINQGMDAMFMYTVTMGLVALLMAWIVILMALKGWAVRREVWRQTRSRRVR